MDGPYISKWTVQRYESGRPGSIKLDDPKVRKWTVNKAFKSFTLDLNQKKSRIVPSELTGHQSYFRFVFPIRTYRTFRTFEELMTTLYFNLSSFCGRKTDQGRPDGSLESSRQVQDLVF